MSREPAQYLRGKSHQQFEPLDYRSHASDSFSACLTSFPSGTGTTAPGPVWTAGTFLVALAPKLSQIRLPCTLNHNSF